MNALPKLGAPAYIAGALHGSAGATTPITVQLVPSFVEIETVMFELVPEVPPYVRAFMSMVRLVKPTVENAGEVTTDDDFRSWA